MKSGNRDDEQVAGWTCGRILRLHRGKPVRREERETSKSIEEDPFGQEAPNTSATSDPHVALEYLASGETKSAAVRTCAEDMSC